MGWLKEQQEIDEHSQDIDARIYNQIQDGLASGETLAEVWSRLRANKSATLERTNLAIEQEEAEIAQLDADNRVLKSEIEQQENIRSRNLAQVQSLIAESLNRTHENVSITCPVVVHMLMYY